MSPKVVHSSPDLPRLSYGTFPSFLPVPSTVHRVLSLTAAVRLQVVLPIHNLTFLSEADQIVCLDNKAIAEQGSYKELVENGGTFHDIMEEFSSNQQEEEQGVKAVAASSEPQPEGAEAAAAPRKEAKIKGDGKMMETEERTRGGLDKGVYGYYLRQSSLFAVVLILFSFMVQQSASVGQNFWMTRWTVQDTDFVIGYDPATWSRLDVLGYFLGIYCLAAFVASMMNNLRSLVIMYIGLRTAKKMHRRLLDHLMKAPVKFFDVTPVGRIVNRFTADMASIDQSVIYQWSSLSDYLLTVMVAMMISSIATPAILVAALPVSYIFWKIQNQYRESARELKRLSSIARSPIFAHFNETIASLTTVRAFKAQDRLIGVNNKNNDNYGRAMLSQQLCFRWLQIRLQVRRPPTGWGNPFQ